MAHLLVEVLDLAHGVAGREDVGVDDADGLGPLDPHEVVGGLAPVVRDPHREREDVGAVLFLVGVAGPDERHALLLEVLAGRQEREVLEAADEGEDLVLLDQAAVRAQVALLVEAVVVEAVVERVAVHAALGVDVLEVGGGRLAPAAVVDRPGQAAHAADLHDAARTGGDGARAGGRLARGRRRRALAPARGRPGADRRARHLGRAARRSTPPRRPRRCRSSAPAVSPSSATGDSVVVVDRADQHDAEDHRQRKGDGEQGDEHAVSVPKRLHNYSPCVAPAAKPSPLHRPDRVASRQAGRFTEWNGDVEGGRQHRQLRNAPYSGARASAKAR